MGDRTAPVGLRLCEWALSLALIVVVSGCALFRPQEYPFTWEAGAGSPGLLEVPVSAITVRSTVELEPCLTSAVVRIAPELDLPALRALVDREPGYGEDYVLYLRAVLEVDGAPTNSGGAALALRDLVDATSGPAPHRFELAWDGTAWRDGALQLAAPGVHSARARIELLRLDLAGGWVTQQMVLDAGTVSGAIGTRSPLAQCRAWQAIAPRLGNARDNTVLVNGRTSGDPPSLTWRRGLPRAVFGNLASPSGDPLAAVAQFLDGARELYAIQDPAAIDALTERRRLPQDGVQVLWLQQEVDGRRLHGSELKALFDGSGGLIYLAGRLDPAPPAQAPIAAITEQEAVDAAAADLAARGRNAIRPIEVVDRVIYRASADSHVLAYELAVAHARLPDDEPWRYLVSAANGAILARQRAVQFSAYPVVTTWQPDLNLVVDNDGNLISGSPALTPGAETIRIDNQRPYTLSDSESGAAGVIDETFLMGPDGEQEFKFFWRNRNINRLPDSFEPQGGATVLDLAGYREIFTGYDAVQEFWSRYAEFPGESDAIDLIFEYDVGRVGGSAPAAYRTSPSDDILVDPTWSGTSHADVSLLVHEAFHHFDGQFIGGFGLGCTEITTTPCDLDVEDDHRMPFALSEGLANFAREIADPWLPGKVPSAGEALPLCMFAPAPTRCLNLSGHTFRKPATLVARPAAMRGLAIDWPDCRSGVDPNACFWIDVPGSGSTFAWPDEALNDVATYALVPQILLEAWEAGASAIAAAHSSADAGTMAEAFPRWLMGAALALNTDASLVELRDVLKLSVLIRAFPWQATLRPAIDQAFAHHGVGAALASFCSANGDLCD